MIAVIGVYVKDHKILRKKIVEDKIMNYIATWIYLDKKGEETNFPQTSMLSSSKEHQDIYWRCVYVFFKFAKRYLTYCEFLLFTNCSEASVVVDGLDLIEELKKMGVRIIVRDFTFKLPNGYYGSWGNQLYEFDILDEFVKRFPKDSKLLMLDSDCLIMKDVAPLFGMLDNSPAVTYWGDDYFGCSEDVDINGITERDMTNLANEYLGANMDRIHYMNGEFFCARYDFIERVVQEFPSLYKFMIGKFEANPKAECVKFNEEAHFLSFFYAKHSISCYVREEWIKRMWTADFYYRVKDGDENIPIWHVLSGKHRYVLFIKDIDKMLAKPQAYVVKKMKSIFFQKDSWFLRKMQRKENFFFRVLRFVNKKTHALAVAKRIIGK